MRAILFAVCIALAPVAVRSAEVPAVLIDMPDGMPIPGEEPCMPVMLKIDRAGVSRVDGHIVPRERLGRTLARLTEARPEYCRRLFVWANDDTPYGDILNVLSLLRRAGIDRIGLVGPSEAD